ncbi:hydrogen peroxide-dependent heme synthase [Alkalibacillus almallahensis]|uniref:hydrogen peroxide-dependent heme synthase n=1 Tax=Alkalibacillus almallahensis TaxID=1379154 RepID=UPI001ABBD0C9|nr:hydrogen peroxide-dependent heme synthase [Alkalibacillus almallahensis]NIK12095.1 chlorite dismutase [Alkalibacillus almallahensis]
MPEAVETLDGWYMLHDFRQIDWTAWKKASQEERDQAVSELNHLMASWQDVEGDKQGSFGFYKMIGHKADLLFLNVRPTTEELTDLEFALDKTKMAEFFTQPYSYISVVELSTYMAQGKDPETDPEIQARLKPILPKWNHICFYPMDKRREGDDNWYMLPKEERGKQMYQHGMTGRKYAGKVRQIISGSQGLDDWEWGVTLFAHDMLQFKKLIYEMRFDEVSARFAEFGSFYIGHRQERDQLEKLLQV